MNYARLSSSLYVSLLVTVLVASCVSTHDTGEVVPSPPGAFQPDAGGKLVDEQAACSQLTNAESSARVRLGCDPVTRKCPDYIRPAGGADCFVYDQASIDGCTAFYEAFDDCSQFDQNPCLLTARSTCNEVDSGTGVGGQSSGGDGATAGDTGLAGLGGANAAGSGS